MDRTLNVIPISSRRRPAHPAAQPVVAVAAAPRRVWALALVAAAVALGAAIVLTQVRTVGSIRGLPPAQREALYRRALEDAGNACATPEARAGALREHCVRQAEFLRLFPECDGRCQTLTWSILPHARR